MSKAQPFGRALLACAASMLMWTGNTLAQDPEAGDVGGSAGYEGEAAAEATWSPPGGSASGSASGSSASDSGGSDGGGSSGSLGGGFESGTDHSQFAGRMGIGFFGVMSLPTCRNGCTGPGAAGISDMDAPTIGVRYWLDETAGVELAAGFGIESGSQETESGNTTQTVEAPSLFGLGLHGGYVMVLADTKHVAFEFVPQLNVGFTTGSRPPMAMGAPEHDLFGVLFEAGATVGTEVHFGFIDLPSLALQANVGAMLSYLSASDEAGDTKTTSSGFRFGTLEGNSPWDFFTGHISAIYYL